MRTALSYFRGRKLVIATKHRKEQVIAPLVEESLGVEALTPKNFDTDQLGTFTGEMERKDDPLTTARNKCRMAMEQFNCDLGIASEGSFGSHPSLFFVRADEELVMLIDKKNDLEIVGRLLSTETNFDGQEVKNEEELCAFAERVCFPSHGLILRNAENGNGKIIKDLTDWPSLLDAFNELKEEYGTAYAETDMRALYNPMRMDVIEEATKNLLDKIHSLCPKCETPGFAITEALPGLPCSSCGFPTKSIISHIYQCRKCEFKLEKKYPRGKKTEEPMYCDLCNP